MIALIKKEILENVTTYRFAILTGLLGILMIVSIIVSYGDYRLRLENYNILRPEPNSINVIIAPNPMSILAKGLDANLGRLYEISMLGIEVHMSQQSVNRLFALFTVPDMLFIIKVMLPLLALLFAFDAICGEKENGTLKLLLTSGSQRISLLFGKLLGRFTLVYVPFLLLFLAAAIIVSLLPDVQADSYYWERTAVIIVVSVLYGLVFSSLGVFISSVVHRSATSMISSLGIWVFFVFVIPNMGTTVAKAVTDLPPSERVELQGRLVAIQAIYERIQREKGSNEGREAFLGMMQQLKEANSQLLENYRPKLNQLVNVTKSIVRLSPTGALTFLITDVANTGAREEFRLKDAITGHVNRNLPRMLGLEKGAIENFQYRRAALGEVFPQSAFVDALLLVLFNLAFIGLAMMNFLRYDPR